MHVFKSKVHCGIVNRFSRALSGLTITWHATCVVVSNKQKKRQKKSMTVRYRWGVQIEQVEETQGDVSRAPDACADPYLHPM